MLRPQSDHTALVSCGHAHLHCGEPELRETVAPDRARTRVVPPTPQEQLDAAIRLITAAADLAGPADGRDELLRGAMVLLRRLSRSLDARLPFLADDNERARRLLRRLRADLASLAPEIDKASTRAATGSESQEHSANLVWQGLLARAVTELADNDAGDRGRAQIAAHLRGRAAANPALHRDPIQRPQLTEEPRA